MTTKPGSWPKLGGRTNAQCDFHHAAARSIPITKHERGPGASAGEGYHVNNRNTRASAKTQFVERAIFFPKEEKEAPPVTLGVVAIWLLAIAFGVAFWTVLFRVASAIVGQILLEQSAYRSKQQPN